MPKNNWKEFKLKELIEIKHGFAFPGKDITNQETDKILVTPGHFSVRGGFLNNHKKFFNGDFDKEYLLNGGDLILSMTDLSKEGDTLGFSAIVPDLNDKQLLHNQRVGKIKIINPIIEKYFLNYLLRTKKYRHWVLSTSTGSTVRHTSPSRIGEYKFYLPPIKYQELISQTLKRFDDKIEVNQKIKKIYEEIPKTLFKSWFINFDPIRAKSKHRSTGLSKEIINLFPKSFEDSNLVKIPMKWKLLDFGKFTIPIRGKVITQKDVNDGNIPVVAGGIEPAYYHNKSNVNGPVITISASGANAGIVNLYQDSIWASDCSYISKEQTNYVFTCYVFLKIFQKKIFALQHGGAQPHINPNDLIRLKFIKPTNDLLDKFEKIIEPFFKSIQIIDHQSVCLANIRDTLLPKIISGKLSNSGIEKFLNETSVQ